MNKFKEIRNLVIFTPPSVAADPPKAGLDVFYFRDQPSVDRLNPPSADLDEEYFRDQPSADRLF